MPPTPRFCTTEQANRWAALNHPLDRYGETDVFDCLECHEDSFKCSVPINLAHCTACGWSISAERLAARLERLQPKEDKPERFDVNLGDFRDPAA